ncbi:cupin domain-containing protein [Aerococcaceae bacterium WGS1372]
MNYIELSIAENKPFPNNSLPVRYYKNLFNEKEQFDAEDIIRWLKTQRFYNFWIDGVYSTHHFHSNTHELNIVVRGHAEIQVGGPNAPILSIQQGEGLFLPAGTSHKQISSSLDFQVVGAYLERVDYDFHKGDYDYETVKRRIEQVPAPDFILSAEGLKQGIA